MKPRLKRMGIGAAGGAALLLVFWLLGDVAHIIGLGLQDSSFFLGVVLFLLGLLMIARGGKDTKYVPAFGHPNQNAVQNSINPSLAGEKEPRQARDAKEVRTAPFVCMGAGLLNLLVCTITFLV